MVGAVVVVVVVFVVAALVGLPLVPIVVVVVVVVVSIVIVISLFSLVGRIVFFCFYCFPFLVSPRVSHSAFPSKSSPPLISRFLLYPPNHCTMGQNQVILRHQNFTFPRARE